MARKKSDEEKLDEQRRYASARTATGEDEFEALRGDPNQAIRAAAAANPHASAAVLERFADDRFWGVRVTVAHHPNTARETLLRMLEADLRRRGIVHAEVRRRLEGEGMPFGEDGLPSGPGPDQG